jgi:hypothetical protein
MDTKKAEIYQADGETVNTAAGRKLRNTQNIVAMQVLKRDFFKPFVKVAVMDVKQPDTDMKVNTTKATTAEFMGLDDNSMKSKEALIYGLGRILSVCFL